MVLTLSQIELAFLCWLTLCLLLLPWPVPRAWALGGIGLIATQTFACMSIRGEGEVIVGTPQTQDVVDSLADVVGVFVVPGLTVALIVVVMWHLARANARLRGRARRRQTIGSDMPTGCGAAAGEGSCITGSSTGESATRPRAA